MLLQVTYGLTFFFNIILSHTLAGCNDKIRTLSDILFVAFKSFENESGVKLEFATKVLSFDGACHSLCGLLLLRSSPH